jgi:hypothetical protein
MERVVEPMYRRVLQRNVMVECNVTVCCITRRYIGSTIRSMTCLLP